jgi:hypothetical protein
MSDFEVLGANKWLLGFARNQSSASKLEEVE